MNKRIILSGVAVFLLSVAGTVAYAANRPTATAGAATSPIQQTLQDQSDELADHEARLANAENNIQTLGTATGTTVTTPPAKTTTTTSPTSTEPTDEPSTPAEPTITSIEQVAINETDTDCHMAFSDGTSRQWHWKTANSETNSCASSLVGKPQSAANSYTFGQ